MRALLKSWQGNFFALGLLVFIITSYFSEGFHQADEHFQILEFSGYKMGNISSSDLMWEFNAQIRPALQVFVVYFLTKFLYLLNITSPFTIVFILRLLTALAAWFAIFKISLLLLDNFKTESGKRIFVAMSMLTWFVPYIVVRFSSENLSGIVFLYAVYSLLKYSADRLEGKVFFLSLTGFLFGISFFLRFQMGIAIAGLGAWLLFVQKMKWKDITLLVFSGLAAILVCISIDFWFYGEWILTPYNYYTVNIAQDKVSSFGVDPWWGYFELFFFYAVPPISIILLLFFLFGAVKNLQSVFVWSILPFIIVHIAIGHKEMRFLFPVLFAFLYLCALGIDQLIAAGNWKNSLRFVFILIIVINTPLLIYRIISPAQEAINYYKFLYDISSEKEVILFSKEKDVYNVAGLQTNYYRSPNLKCFVINDDNELKEYISVNQPDSVFFLERRIKSDLEIPGYVKENLYCFFPDWILAFNYNDWTSRSRVWSIQQFTKQKE